MMRTTKNTPRNSLRREGRWQGHQDKPARARGLTRPRVLVFTRLAEPIPCGVATEIPQAVPQIPQRHSSKLIRSGYRTFGVATEFFNWKFIVIRHFPQSNHPLTCAYVMSTKTTTHDAMIQAARLISALENGVSEQIKAACKLAAEVKIESKS